VIRPKTLSILATIVAVLAIARMAMTNRVFGTGPISIGLQVAAALLMLWARLTFGMRSFHAAANPTEGELVTSGPYALVRNPIYVAVLLFTWTAVAVHFDAETVLLGLVITAGMLVRVFVEERLLRVQYRTYADYERRVKRLIPFVF
jgi:protein-S-isoprenylcysteine O-methyltransferase Ste14